MLNGTYYGRSVVLRGITISHLDEDGRTVEDRGHSDSIALLGQIGVIRTLILGLEILTRRVRLPKGVLKGTESMRVPNASAAVAECAPRAFNPRSRRLPGAGLQPPRSSRLRDDR